jgi:hypothetical protein
METLYVVVAVLVLSVGLTLWFVGSLVAVLTALGNKQWFWGIGMLCFLPSSVVYCWGQREIATWPRKLVSIGWALVLADALAVLLWQAGTN